MIFIFLDSVIFDDEIHETASPLSLKRQTRESGIFEVAAFTGDPGFRHFALIEPLPRRA